MWFRAMDSLPLRCAPAGNDTEGVTARPKLGVIPGERSEGRGSTHTRNPTGLESCPRRLITRGDLPLQ